jgi:hypothetical protein
MEIRGLSVVAASVLVYLKMGDPMFAAIIFFLFIALVPGERKNPPRS